MSDLNIQQSHFGYPVTLESIEPWTWRRIPLWSSEVPFSLCSLAGPLSVLAPVFIVGGEPYMAIWIRNFLEGCGFERVEIDQ